MPSGPKTSPPIPQVTFFSNLHNWLDENPPIHFFNRSTFSHFSPLFQCSLLGFTWCNVLKRLQIWKPDNFCNISDWVFAADFENFQQGWGDEQHVVAKIIVRTQMDFCLSVKSKETVCFPSYLEEEPTQNSWLTFPAISNKRSKTFLQRKKNIFQLIYFSRK